MGTKLLVAEQPLVVLPSLATAIGLNEAIVLQQLHYWLGKADRDAEGLPWVFNSYAGWQEQMPFMSERTLRRVFRSLERNGYVRSKRARASSYDQRKWYTILYDAVPELALTMRPSGPARCGQSDRIGTAPLDECKEQRLRSETTEESISSSAPQTHPANGREAELRLVGEKPKKGALTPEFFVRLYHEFAPSMPRVQKLTDARRKKCACRAREHPDPVWWATVFAEVEATPFLRGEAGKGGWPGATFDWCLENEGHALSISEGKYRHVGRDARG